jgi:hypothetical protein
MAAKCLAKLRGLKQAVDHLLEGIGRLNYREAPKPEISDPDQAGVRMPVLLSFDRVGGAEDSNYCQ